MEQTIFCICGRTASGKDSLTDAISRELGIPKIISFTNRPKRTGEDDTKHIFLSNEQTQKLLDSCTPAAYTEIGEYKYFTTVDQLEAMLVEHGCLLYVIDPNGIEFLKSKMPDKRIVIIYINVPRLICKQRAEARGDDPVVYHKRSVAENAQFLHMCRRSTFDYAVSNIDSEIAVDVLKHIVIAEMNKEQ